MGVVVVAVVIVGFEMGNGGDQLSCSPVVVVVGISIDMPGAQKEAQSRCPYTATTASSLDHLILFVCVEVVT